MDAANHHSLNTDSGHAAGHHSATAWSDTTAPDFIHPPLTSYSETRGEAAYRSVSTLGPERTNSHDAALSFLLSRGGSGQPLLCRTAEDSIEALLDGKVDGCVVCNLYPDIHKLYLPNLHRIYAADVFLYTAEMGLFARDEAQAIRTVAAPPTSTAFIQDDLASDNFAWVWAPSNTEAARMCRRGEVDGAVGTDASAEEEELIKIRDFGAFSVPYTVFRLKR